MCETRSAVKLEARLGMVFSLSGCVTVLWLWASWWASSEAAQGLHECLVKGVSRKISRHGLSEGVVGCEQSL